MSNLNSKMSLFKTLYNREPSLSEWMKFSSDSSVDDMLTTKGKESHFKAVEHCTIKHSESI